MEFLIHFIARLLARRLENGSGLGAIVGSLVGVLGGIITAYYLRESQRIDSMVAPAISMSLVFAIVSALIGSAIGPRTLHEAMVVPGGSVRLTNFNRGLVPLVFIAIFATLLILTNRIPIKSEDNRQVVTILQWGLSIAIAISLWFQFRRILWIEIGPVIVIRKPLSRTIYRHEDIRDVGFEVSRGRYVLESLPGDALFAIQFVDGRSCFLRSPGHKTGAVSAILRSHGARRG